MGQVERQPVAHVDAGVQLITRVQRQGLADPRLEVQVPPENAAAERAGHEDAVAGPGARRGRAARGRSLLPAA